MTEYLSTSAVAARLGRTSRMVRRYVATGRLPAIRIGHSLAIPASALADFEFRPRGNPSFVSRSPVTT